MRLATITNWAYGATVALTLASGVTMFAAARAEDRERAAVAERETFDQLTATLEEDTYRLTEQARLYSVNANPSHLVIYRREAAALGSVESRVARLRDAGAQPAELGALRDALHWADSLRDEQEAALAAVQRDDADAARAIMFGAEYERDLERVADRIDRFQSMLDQRCDAAVGAATAMTKALRRSSEIAVGVTALLFLFVLVIVLKHRILRPVVRLSDVVTRLAAQDFEAEPPTITHVDEIGDMAQAIRVFRDNGLARQRLEQERDQDRSMRDLLARMTQRLQGCEGIADLGQVVALFCAEIAPGFGGRLSIFDEQRQLMVELCAWRDPIGSARSFPPADCWALRRGQLHRPAGREIDIRCAHIGESDRDDICLPLTAQGETLGLLYLEPRAGAAAPPATLEVYLELLAETVSLAIANLRLRDALREKALVDPLTGLSNRRQLDGTLAARVAEAEGNGAPLACLMLDVDHFKQFNDRFGHDAGDAVLRAVAGILGRAVRGEGTAFRFGGEEFLLLMPGFDLCSARVRAEEIRGRVAALKVKHGGKPLGSITCSIGIAAWPEHGGAEALVATADAALLRAKEQGRDRIVVASVRGRQSRAA